MTQATPVGEMRRGGLPVSEQQAAVVDHVRERRVTVVGAGAGSGKTHTTVATVLELLERREADLHEFVLITFTNQAADELRARLEEELERRRDAGESGEEVSFWREQQERASAAYIGTIHGFCAWILRTYGYDAAIARELTVTRARSVLTDSMRDAVEHVLDPASALFGGSVDLREYELFQRVLDLWDLLRNLGLDPGEILERTREQPEDPGKSYRVEMAEVLVRMEAEYNQRKAEQQALDATDLLQRTVALLAGPTGRELAQRLSRRFRYVFVDEFQDTDIHQKRILDRLLPAIERLLVVGDRKQSVYGFRGARVSLLDEIAREHEVEVLPLSLSRRPSQGLLRVQNALFAAMSDRYPFLGEFLDLPPGISGEGGTVPPLTYASAGFRTTRADRIELMARWIVDLLEHQIVDRKQGTTRPVRPRDVVLLFRSNGALREYDARLQELLADRSIPLNSEGVRGYFQQPEIVSTHHLLRLILHYPNDTALAMAIRTPYLRDVDATAQEQHLLQYGSREGTPLTDWFEDHYPEHRDRLEELRYAVRTHTVSQILALLYDRFGVRAYYEAQGDRLAAGRLEQLREVARNLFRSEQALTLRQFTSYLQRAILSGRDAGVTEVGSADSAELAGDAVRLMTVHAAKGLEFPIVIIPKVQAAISDPNHDPPFLVSPEAGLDLNLPLVGSRSTASPGFHAALAENQRQRVEEEMRIFYVAITRAQEAVLLVGSVYGQPNLPTSDWYSWQDEVRRARANVLEAGGAFP